eukprot:8830038-Pyramimonas_sp.AAC.1
MGDDRPAPQPCRYWIINRGRKRPIITENSESETVAKTTRAPRTKTTAAGHHNYQPGNFVDYHRPTITKDGWGGWNGPCPIARNCRDRAQAVAQVGGREVLVQCPDLRRALQIVVLMVREIGSDTTALRTLWAFVASLPAGKPVMVFGYLPTKQGNLRMTTACRLSPKVHLALQFPFVAAVLAERIHDLPVAPCADGCALVCYVNDVAPGFHCNESERAALDMYDVAVNAHARIILRSESTKPLAGFDEDPKP